VNSSHSGLQAHDGNRPQGVYIYSQYPPLVPRLVQPDPAVQPARFWRRFCAACLIDPLIMMAIFLPLLLVGNRLVRLGPPTDDFGTDWADWMHLLVVDSAPLIYCVGMTMLGGTVGYRLLGLRVYMARGGHPDLLTAMIRQWPGIVTYLSMFAVIEAGQISGRIYTGPSHIISVVAVIVILLSLAVWSLGCVAQIWNPQRRAWHDRWADTLVLHSFQPPVRLEYPNLSR